MLIAFVLKWDGRDSFNALFLTVSSKTAFTMEGTLLT